MYKNIYTQIYLQKYTIYIYIYIYVCYIYICMNIPHHCNDVSELSPPPRGLLVMLSSSRLMPPPTTASPPLFRSSSNIDPAAAPPLCARGRECESECSRECESVRVWECERLRVWECVSVWVWECESEGVCERERERERTMDRDRWKRHTSVATTLQCLPRGPKPLDQPPNLLRKTFKPILEEMIKSIHLNNLRLCVKRINVNPSN